MGINLLSDLGYDDGDIEVRKAREAALVYAELMDSLVESRKGAGLNQTQLAQRMGTSQSAVSALENGADARLSTLIKYAQASGCEIHISVTPSATATHSKNPDWVTIKVNSDPVATPSTAWVDTSAATMKVGQVRIAELETVDA